MPSNHISLIASALCIEYRELLHEFRLNDVNNETTENAAQALEQAILAIQQAQRNMEKLNDNHNTV